MGLFDVDQISDIILDSQTYMIARSEQLHEGGRAWQEDMIPKTTARRTELDAQYGVAEPEIEIPFAWETWHAGYGDLDVASEDRYRNGFDHDPRWRGKIQAAPAVSLTTISLGASPQGNDAFWMQLKGKYFLGIGRYFIQAWPTATLLKDFGSGFSVRGGTVYKNRGFIGVADLNTTGTVIEQNFWEFDGDTTFSQNSQGMKAGYWTQARQKVWRTYFEPATNASLHGRFVVASADGSLGATVNWSNGFEVGEESVPITGIFEYNGGPMVTKRDGLYAYINSDREFRNLLPPWRQAQNDDNGKAAIAWQGGMLVGAERGLSMVNEVNFRVFEVRDVGPNRVAQKGTPQGYFTSLIADGPWVWGMMHSPQADAGYLMTGRLQNEGEGIPQQGGMVWHPMREFTSSEVAANARKFRAIGINTATVASGNNPVLMVALPNNSATVGWYEMVLPRGGGDPANDTACRFNRSVTAGRKFSTPFHDLSAPTTLKTFTEVTVETEDVSASLPVTVAIASPSTTVTLGQILSPGRKTFAVNNAVFPNALKARVELNVVGTGNTTGKVTKVIGKAILRPDFVDVRQAVVRIANRVPLRWPGSVDERDAETMLNHLRSLTKRGPVRLRTPAGVEEEVVVFGRVRVTESAQFGTAERELLATIQMRKVGLTTGTGFKWDGATKWNGTGRWS